MTDHTVVLCFLDTIESDANNAQLKALAKSATPVSQSYSTEAQGIQKQLTSAM